MVDLIDPLGLEQRGGFFAPDAAGAEHRDAWRGGYFGAVLAEPGGEVAEAFGVRIDRAGEAADAHFVVVPRVDNERAGLVDQRVPIGGRDIAADAADRVDGFAHRHDLALEPDLEAVERHRLGGRKFDLDIGAIGERADMREDAVDAVGRPGDGAVDPLGREQEGALDAVCFAQVEQRPAQRRSVRKAGKAVERGDADHASLSHAFSNAAR